MRAGVIGAGIGGLAAACLLRQRGYEVDVYEKEALPGGRALTIDAHTSLETYRQLLERFDMWVPFARPSLEDIFAGGLEGYRLDLGFHLMGGGDQAAPMQILSSLGIKQDIIGSRLGFIGESVDYPYLSLTDKLAMLPRIMQLLLSRKKTIAALERVPMSETIQKYGRGKMKLTLELFPRLITTVNDLHRISTGETFWAQRELMGSHPVSYPVGGLGSLARNLAHWLEGHGGRLLHREVEKVVIDRGTARGIVAETEEDYDLVVSNLPAQDTFTIADPDAFPAPYVREMKSLEGTGSLCAWYALNHLDSWLLGKAFTFIEREAGVEGNDAAGMIDFKTACPETALAPPGKYLVQAYIICTPEEARDPATAARLREVLDRHLTRLVPRWEQHLEWALYPAIWHLDGVAKTIDRPKPDVVTPVRHFYLVGDSTKAKGVGINCAADSARVLMQKLDAPG